MLVDERRLPARQGRPVLAYLASERWRPATRDETNLAIQCAGEVARLDPFREAGHPRLMRAHAVLGNRAEVHRVYARCRQLRLEEVSVDPSPEVEALYRSLVRSAAASGD
jgi:two-component SAPR family response regulator